MKGNKGWDELTNWYSGWVGKDGSKYHQRIVVPNILDLLNLKPGEKVLEIGCGTGILAKYVVDKGCEYVGTDIAPKMVDAAKRNAPRSAKFLVADSAKVFTQTNLQPESFDAVVFMLSLQDMPDLNRAIESAARALKEHGRVAICLTHPAFRIPRQSGWGFDDKRKLTFRRIDSYLKPLRIPLNPAGRSISFSHHRPIMDYVNTLSDHNFSTTKMLEIPDTQVHKEKENPTIPMFLFLKALKLKVVK